MNRIAQIEEDWHRIDDGCSKIDTPHSTPAQSDKPQGSSALEQRKLSENNTQHSKPAQSDEPQGSSTHEQGEVPNNNTQYSTPAQSDEPQGSSTHEQGEVLNTDIPHSTPAQPDESQRSSGPEQGEVPNNNTQHSKPAESDETQGSSTLEQGEVPNNDTPHSTPTQSDEYQRSSGPEQGEVPNNNTQHSTPAQSNKLQESSGPEQGKISDNNTPHSTPAQSNDPQRSSGFEQGDVTTSVSSHENLQHDKNPTPNSRTAADQVRIRCDEYSVTRELDKNMNLIPLPPVTPPPKGSNPRSWPSVSAHMVVLPCVPAAVSSSASTISPASFADTPLLATYRFRTVKESPRRPHRISKAWKAARGAGRSPGVQSSPQDTNIVVNGPSEYAWQDASCENRQTETRSECAEVSGFELSDGFDAPGDGAENDVPRVVDSVKEYSEIKRGESLDAEEGNVNGQYPRDYHIAIETKSIDTAANDLPKTDGMILQGHDGIEDDWGMDTKHGNMGPQHLRVDNPDKKEKSGDTAVGDVPKTHDIFKGHNEIESDRGLGIADRNIEARYPGKSSPKEEEKSGATAASNVPKTNGMHQGHGGIERNSGLGIENGNIEAQHPKEDTPGKEEKSDINGKADIADAVELVRKFASRGLALLMVAKGFNEQEQEGEGQKAVEHPLDKKVHVRAGCNQSFTERGLALLMESMDGSIRI